MSELKLGPLPKVRYVRRSIMLPEPLSEELEEYAAEHSRLYEPVDAIALIPHMLEEFLRSDRGWRTRRARKGRSDDRSKPVADLSRRHEPGA